MNIFIAPSKSLINMAERRNLVLLTKVIPNIHLAAESTDFNDSLSKKVVRLTTELRPESGL